MDLTFALLIFTVAVALFFKTDKKKVKLPWFIGLFVVAMVLNSYVPFIANFSKELFSISRVGLTVTLFLIGAGLSFAEIRAVGWRPLVLGITLWLFISVLSFWVISGL